MAKKTKQVAKGKIKKKKWYPVLGPKSFNEQVIGEIPLFEIEDMAKRKLTINMMNLTGHPRNQHSNVTLRIKEVKDGKGCTEITGFMMMPSSVKRLVRKGRTKVDDSIVVLTKDNQKVRIKPLIFTKGIVYKSVSNSLRLKIRNAIAIFASKINYEGLINEIMNYKLQKLISNVAKTVTPVRTSEIRAFNLVEKEGVKVIKPVAEKEHKKKNKKKTEEIIEEEEAKEEKTNKKTTDEEENDDKEEEIIEEESEETE